MLIITRKNGESVLIGDDIEVTILKIEDGSIKIGINAPGEVTILRKEVYERVKEENKKAASSNTCKIQNTKKGTGNNND